MPRHSLAQIKELEDQLSFDENDVAYRGKAYKEVVQSALGFLANENSTSPLFKTIYKKLGLWFAFYSREKEPALTYLKLYSSTLEPHSEALAEATNWHGYAHTIDPSYKVSTLFDRAHNLYSQLYFEHKYTSLSKLQRGMAFSRRYDGLIKHRHFLNDEAQRSLKEASNIYSAYLKAPDIELAETYHLWAVSLIRQKKYKPAVELLERAYQIEDQYRVTYGAHYLQFITMQSLADANRRLAEDMQSRDPVAAKKLLDQAVEMLSNALTQQLTYYGTRVNADVAKTIQFLGDAYLSGKNYLAAMEEYLTVLNIKLEIYKDINDPMVKFTTDGIQKLLTELTQYFDFDWNDYKKIESNKPKAHYVQAIVDMCVNSKSLNAESIKLLSKLTLTLSTFHNHVQRDPVSALKYQSLSEDLNGLPELDNDWLKLHISFSLQQVIYQSKTNKKLLSDIQPYIGQKNANDLYELAMKMIMEVRSKPNQDLKLSAFSYCLEALLDYEINCLAEGVRSYRVALDLYEKNDLLDDQYARAKNRYAQMLCEQKFPLEDPKKIYGELKEYWDKKNEPNNPYAQRFYQSYREFLESKPNRFLVFSATPSTKEQTVPEYTPAAGLRQHN